MPPAPVTYKSALSFFFLGILGLVMKVFRVPLPACWFVSGGPPARAETHLRLASALLWLSAFDFWLATQGSQPLVLRCQATGLAELTWGVTPETGWQPAAPSSRQSHLLESTDCNWRLCLCTGAHWCHGWFRQGSGARGVKGWAPFRSWNSPGPSASCILAVGPFPPLIKSFAGALSYIKYFNERVTEAPCAEPALLGLHQLPQAGKALLLAWCLSNKGPVEHVIFCFRFTKHQINGH